MSERSEFDRGFWLRHLVGPLLLFVALALPFELGDLDLRLSDPFYDPVAKRWPQQQAFWTAVVVHKWGKYFVWLLGLVPAVVLVGSRWRAAWAPYRRLCAFTIAGLAGTPGFVALLKVLTNRHCPWGIDRYGGNVPWTRLFDPSPIVEGTGPGVCFPAAHAATGFGLLVLYFAARALPGERRWPWLLPGLLLGLLFGFGQHARGAHFASHTLWSLAVGWFLPLVLYHLCGGRARLAPRALNAGGSAR